MIIAPLPPQPGEMGPMRRPTLVKSLLIVNGSDAIGGVEYGVTLVYHARWRKYFLYAESHGTIYAYRADSLHSSRQFKAVNTFRLPVGHYHVLPYDNLLLAPHTGAHRCMRGGPLGACALGFSPALAHQALRLCPCALRVLQARARTGIDWRAGQPGRARR